MLTLINPNRMNPPIAPIGLDYVATAARRVGIPVHVIDLGLQPEPDAALGSTLGAISPSLVGISFRNVDDCFWPSGTWFVPDLLRLVRRVRQLCAAPVVLGGVGFSVFASRLTELTGADFGIRGDGEDAVPALWRALNGGEDLGRVPGLIWRAEQRWIHNPPAWPERLDVPSSRDAIDNAAYFVRGGQAGVETKRGCPCACIYCADPLAKGRCVRMRAPTVVADEFEALGQQGITMVHLCDGEFNLPRAHAREVSAELARRGVGDRIQWYAYASVVPFDLELARSMRRAGCVGIDFTGDAGSDAMLSHYQQTHRREDLERAVDACRDQGITCMIDLLLGGPGETPDTVRETLDFMRSLDPDCVGASLGMRLYPGTEAAALVSREGPWEKNPSVVRHYTGEVDLLRPTFYVSEALGEHPATLIRELIAGDSRFFPPAEERAPGHAGSDHNYNDHAALAQAIAGGARGAYWDILRRLAVAQPSCVSRPSGSTEMQMQHGGNR